METDRQKDKNVYTGDMKRPVRGGALDTHGLSTTPPGREGRRVLGLMEKPSQATRQTGRVPRQR